MNINNDDIIIYDDIIPLRTQQRILETAIEPNLHWMDFDEYRTAGDKHFKRHYSNDTLNIIPSDCLIKLAYTAARNPENPAVIHEPECFHYIGLSILDMFTAKSGIKVSKIIRMKLNNQRPSIDPNYNTLSCNDIHVDLDFPHKTLLYYINDSDGDTFIMNERYKSEHSLLGYEINTSLANRVSPKQGRLVCFDGLRYHAPSNPINTRRRYVLNINFIQA